MKSIKPGRGSSAMGAAGSIGAVIFGIFWTIIAFSITRDAPFPLVGIVFPLFGVVFVITGIVQAVIHYKNATGKNRMSIVDIVDSREEPDPLDHYFDRDGRSGSNGGNGGSRLRTEFSSNGTESAKKFCPYCGSRIESPDYDYCPQCGKPIQ